jgi:hypothetical protein
MSDTSAPGARLQYDLSKRYSADREPTHDEWARDYDALAAENARLREALFELHSVNERLHTYWGRMIPPLDWDEMRQTEAKVEMLLRGEGEK